MAIDVDDDLPMFTTPSGSPLDELLLSLLNSAAGQVNSGKVVAISLTMIDANMNASTSWVLDHATLGVHLAHRLRQMAERIEQGALKHKAPDNNQSQRVH
jgi:hypothetical protein